ncbi:MAG: AsmA family protein [Gammaproteobacteria bacterium]|nr:AsmA family protein [Gammaproteobacteria bacterium]
MKKALKFTLIGFLGLIVIAVIAIPFIPAESYRGEIESQIDQMLGMHVKLGDISLTSLPSPGIKVDDIQLSDNDKVLLTLNSIEVFPRLSSLLSETPEIRKIHLSGINLHADDIGRLSELANNQESTDTQSSGLLVKRVTADNNIIQLDESHSFGPFKFEAKLSETMQLSMLEILHEADSVKLKMIANAKDYDIQLQATNWTPPLEPALKISSLQAKGKLQPTKLHLDTINVTAYQGTVNGNLIVDWHPQWLIDSRIETAGLNLGQLLKDLQNNSFDGTQTGQFTIRATAKEAAHLVDNLHITGDSKTVNGHIYNADLEQAARALSSEWVSGGQTPFDESSSHVNITSHKIQLSDIKITSSLLAVEGKLDIKDLNNLNGRLNVGLNDPTGFVTMPLMVGGTLDAPKVRPTDEALAGGAIGTAILGPGVGTAVGVKAGEFLGKIGSLFGSDDDEKKTAPKPAQNNDSTLDEDSY